MTATSVQREGNGRRGKQPGYVANPAMHAMRACRCFHDRDIAPEGASLAETNALLDKVRSADWWRIQRLSCLGAGRSF